MRKESGEDAVQERLLMLSEKIMKESGRLQEIILAEIGVRQTASEFEELMAV